MGRIKNVLVIHIASKPNWMLWLTVSRLTILESCFGGTWALKLAMFSLQSPRFLRKWKEEKCRTELNIHLRSNFWKSQKKSVLHFLSLDVCQEESEILGYLIQSLTRSRKQSSRVASGIFCEYTMLELRDRQDRLRNGAGIW